jgi:poly-gamma-glutamate synthesis protein (capsule biosynthesis protein)
VAAHRVPGTLPSAVRRAVATLAVVVALGACSVGPDAAGGAEGASDGGASGRSDVEVAGATHRAPQPVSFVFGGDVHFEGRVEASLARSAGGPLAGMAGSYAEEEIVVVNLETAITETTGAVGKTYTFKAPPARLAQLVADGVDVVSLANNHGMDFGAQGLADTLAAADAAGLPLVGAGLDAAEAYAPWTTTVGDHRVAVLGATQVLDNAFEAAWTAGADRPGLASAKQPQRLIEAVTRAAAEADTVAVVVHWGVEKQTCPTADQQALAEALVGAGADIVVGGHAHRLQGAGRMGTAVVGYGLGNLVFDTPDASDGARSGMLRVRADGTGHLDYQWLPAAIVGGLPERVEGAAEAAAVADWTALRSCTGLTG